MNKYDSRKGADLAFIVIFFIFTIGTVVALHFYEKKVLFRNKYQLEMTESPPKPKQKPSHPLH